MRHTVVYYVGSNLTNLEYCHECHMHTASLIRSGNPEIKENTYHNFIGVKDMLRIYVKVISKGINCLSNVAGILSHIIRDYSY